jgi:hypothetical protein
VAVQIAGTTLKEIENYKAALHFNRKNPKETTEKRSGPLQYQTSADDADDAHDDGKPEKPPRRSKQRGATALQSIGPAGPRILPLKAAGEMLPTSFFTRNHCGRRCLRGEPPWLNEQASSTELPTTEKTTNEPASTLKKKK